MHIQLFTLSLLLYRSSVAATDTTALYQHTDSTLSMADGEADLSRSPDRENMLLVDSKAERLFFVNIQTGWYPCYLYVCSISGRMTEV